MKLAMVKPLHKTGNKENASTFIDQYQRYEISQK